MTSQKKALGEIATFSQGIQVSRSDQYSCPGEGRERFLRILDYTQTAQQIRYIAEVDKRYKVKEEDLVMVRYGATSGYVGIGKKGIIANNLIKITPQNTINKKFLYYFLRQASIQSYIQMKAKASAIPAVNFGILETIEVPIFSLEKQEQLARILDKLHMLIQKREEQLDILQALEISLFNESFGRAIAHGKGWTTSLIKEVTFNEDYKRIPLERSLRIKKKGKYPYYGASGIIDSIDDFCVSGRRLLVAEDGQNLETRHKEIAFLAEGEYWVNNHVHILGATKQVNLLYLKFVLNQMNLAGFITGTTQPKLTKANLGKVPISLPPISLQKKFAYQIEQIGKQKQLINRSLDSFKKYFLIITQKAFKGEILK